VPLAARRADERQIDHEGDYGDDDNRNLMLLAAVPRRSRDRDDAQNETDERYEDQRL
jgi:hypothetical protein